LAEYERRRRDLEQRDEALAGQERQLEAQADQRIELAGVAGSVEEFCERVRSGLADATFEQRRELVELLVDRVIVTDEEVEIRYVVPTDPSSEKVRFCHLRSDYLDHPNLGVALPEQGFVEHLTAYVDVGQEPTELVLPVLIKLQPHPLALELRLGEAASLRSVGLDVLRGVHGLWGVHADEPDVLDAAYGGRYLDGVAVYDPRHRGRRFVLLRPCCGCQVPAQREREDADDKQCEGDYPSHNPLPSFATLLARTVPFLRAIGGSAGGRCCRDRLRIGPRRS
jgi:hypothetical protein